MAALQVFGLTSDRTFSQDIKDAVYGAKPSASWGGATFRMDIVPGMTEADGAVTEYRSPDFKGDPSKFEIRRMDCLDCHNRVGHQLRTPDAAVDLAMSLGKIDPALPSIKKNAVAVLAKIYASEKEAAEKIAAELAGQSRPVPGATWVRRLRWRWIATCGGASACPVARQFPPAA